MPMDLFKLFKALSLTIRTSEGKALVMADPHIGFELTRGIKLRTGFEEKLASFIVDEDPDVLIILGDMKDPIGVDRAISRMLERFFATIGDVRTIITKGNHDGRIENMIKGSNVKVVDHVVIDDVLFIHGHRKLPPVEFREAYLGHVHPVHLVKFKGTVKRAKVFVRAGKYLIMPTINPYLDGFSISEGIRMVSFLRGVKVVRVFLPEGVYIGSVAVDRT